MCVTLAFSDLVESGESQEKGLSKKEMRDKHIVSVGGSFLCVTCGYKSDQRSNMIRHVDSKHLEPEKFPCSMCQSEFKRSDHRIAHYKKAHGLKLTAKEARAIDLKKAEQ